MADNNIDKLHDPVTISDDTWAWHFNRSIGGDSRFTLRDRMLNMAKDACNSRSDDPDQAAQYLGWALHPDQDWVAHGDYNRKWDAPLLVGVGFPESLYYWHNFGDEGVGGFRPDDPELDANGSIDGRPTIEAMRASLRGSYGGFRMLSNGDLVYWVTYHYGHQRIDLTKDRTIKILKDFQSYVKSQSMALKCQCAF